MFSRTSRAIKTERWSSSTFTCRRPPFTCSTGDDSPPNRMSDGRTPSSTSHLESILISISRPLGVSDRPPGRTSWRSDFTVHTDFHEKVGEPPEVVQQRREREVERIDALHRGPSVIAVDGKNTGSDWSIGIFTASEDPCETVVAYPASDFSLSSGTESDMVLDIVAHDSLQTADFSNNRITVPERGITGWQGYQNCHRRLGRRFNSI